MKGDKIWSRFFRPSCFGDPFEWGRCHAAIDLGERKECSLSEKCFKECAKRDQD